MPKPVGQDFLDLGVRSTGGEDRLDCLGEGFRALCRNTREVPDLESVLNWGALLEHLVDDEGPGHADRTPIDGIELHGCAILLGLLVEDSKQNARVVHAAYGDTSGSSSQFLGWRLSALDASVEFCFALPARTKAFQNLTWVRLHLELQDQLWFFQDCFSKAAQDGLRSVFDLV